MKKVMTWEERFADINLMRQRFAVVMSELIEVNPDIVLVLADITAERFHDVTARFPERVINVGIREQLMIDMASGLAIGGLRPFVHTFASFLIERPFEQIKIALTHQDIGAVLVSAGASYDLSVDGRTHQSPADVALLNTLANWNIYIPGHAEEAERALRIVAEGTGCDYIRLSTESNHLPYWKGETHFIPLKIGKSGTIIAVGPVADRTVAAAKDLDVTILYAPFIRPFDKETLLKTLSLPAVAIVEPYLVGTSAQQVSEALIHIPHRILSLGVQLEELRKFGTPQEHIQYHGLDEENLKNQLTAFFTVKHD
ncbi:transketolase [Serratia fonticola]|jgi:transketolase|uniref:Transketolase n=1 Tax=Serratia fonticola TaxID=47917 RepID=A0A542D210_SERFO|nr:transketolase [Serratia fonticola]TQI80896.1 transketolase [Serratia fonticola]TQI97079.1 transketolase [Serratia fonticola]TVZ71575.1 transketolase [Serratia fonticola]